MLKEIKANYKKAGLEDVYQIVYNEALDRVIRKDEYILKPFKTMILCKLKSEKMEEMTVKEIADLAAAYQEAKTEYNFRLNLEITTELISKEIRKIETEYTKKM